MLLPLRFRFWAQKCIQQLIGNVFLASIQSVRSKPIILTAHSWVFSALLRRPWVGICYRVSGYNGRKIVMLCYYWGRGDVNKCWAAVNFHRYLLNQRLPCFKYSGDRWQTGVSGFLSAFFFFVAVKISEIRTGPAIVHIPRCVEFLIVELLLHGERKAARPSRSERLLLVTGRNININDILPGRAVMRANFVSDPLIYEWNASLCAVIWKVNSLSADLVRTEAADNCERPGCDFRE